LLLAYAETPAEPEDPVPDLGTLLVVQQFVKVDLLKIIKLVPQ
jgi:hypothetical protein